MSENGLALRSNSNGHSIISAAEIQAQVKEMVPLLREVITNGRKLTEEQIVGRAMFAASQGLDPITEVHTLTDGQGRTMGHTMAINGYRRKCLEQLDPGDEISLEFTEVPPEKMPKGCAYGYECRLRDGQSYRHWQKRLLEVGKAIREAMGAGQIDFATLKEMVGPAPVFVGIGYFWQSEFSEYKDKNYPPQERAKKRAENNARTKRFPKVAPMQYDIAEGSGVLVRPDAIDAMVSDAPAQKPTRSVDTITGEILGSSPVESDAKHKEPAPAAEPSPEPATEPAEGEWPQELFDQNQPTPEELAYADACEVMTSEKPPRKYGDLPNDDLLHRKMGIEKGMGTYTPAGQEAAQAKLAAIKIILDWRAAHP